MVSSIKKLKTFALVASILLVLAVPLMLNSNGIAEIRNFADSIKEQQDNSIVISKTTKIENIEIGKPFAINYSLSNAKNLPFKFAAIKIEYDPTYINIKSIETDDKFTTVKDTNNILYVLPNHEDYKSLINLLNNNWKPSKCNAIGGCTITSLKTTQIDIKINAVLSQAVTEYQRPIRITYFTYTEMPTKILWSTNAEDPYLPEISMIKNQIVQNKPPRFISKPKTEAIINSEYSYNIKVNDADQDNITLSLSCPKMLFCKDKPLEYPDGFKITGNKLIWQVKDIGKSAIPVRIYASDGKSVSEQNFVLKIYTPEESQTQCSFVSASNPYKIVYNLPTTLLLQAENPDGIKQIEIQFINNNQVEDTITYKFNNTQKVVLDEKSTPPLIYRFNKGEYMVKAIITDAQDKTKDCYLTLKTKDKERSLTKFLVSSLFIVKAQNDTIIPTNNTAPSIISNYKDTTAPNTGNNININTNYHYTLVATDADNDNLSFTIVRRPSEWSNLTITTTNSSDGHLEVTISGTPTKAGSYTFSISVTDGYNWTTQTWIVNVNDPNNKAPRITTLQPTQALTLKAGQTLTISWEAEDEQQIKYFGLYYATDPNDTSTYVTINSKIKYTVRNYLYKTGLMPGGTYYFILTATDSYNPPATGKAIIGPVTIVAPTPTPTPANNTSSQTEETSTATSAPFGQKETTKQDTGLNQKDTVVITILSPEPNSTIEQQDFKLMAKITASKGATLESKDIHVYLNNQEITDEVSFSRDKGELISLVYRPAEYPPTGENILKIEAQDSNKDASPQSATINFVIKENSDTTQVSNDEEYYTFFNYRLTKTQRNILYLILGLAALIIILPLILYLTSSSEPKHTQTDKSTKQTTPPPTTLPPSNNNNLYPWLKETPTGQSTNSTNTQQTVPNQNDNTINKQSYVPTATTTNSSPPTSNTTTSTTSNVISNNVQRQSNGTSMKSQVNTPPVSADIPNLQTNNNIPGQKIQPGTTIRIN